MGEDLCARDYAPGTDHSGILFDAGAGGAGGVAVVVHRLASGSGGGIASGPFANYRPVEGGWNAAGDADTQGAMREQGEGRGREGPVCSSAFRRLRVSEAWVSRSRLKAELL